VGVRKSAVRPDLDQLGQQLAKPRLPPGRHGLDRNFVVKNQRDRLAAGIVAVTAAGGYQQATVTQICAAAGVSRRTFYSYFSSKEDCFLEVFDLLIDVLIASIDEAAGEEPDWPHAVKARLLATLELFTANPDLVRFGLLEPARAGGEIAARHRTQLGRVLEALVATHEGDEPPRRPPPEIEQAMVGGVFSLIGIQVEEGHGAELVELLPDLVELFLAPYVGRKEAVKVGSSVAGR